MAQSKGLTATVKFTEAEREAAILSRGSPPPAPAGKRFRLDAELLLRSLGRRLSKAHLARQRMLVALEHQVDPLPDVHCDRHLRATVQQMQPLVLLRRDVDGRGNLFA